MTRICVCVDIASRSAGFPVAAATCLHSFSRADKSSGRYVMTKPSNVTVTSARDQQTGVLYSRCRWPLSLMHMAYGGSGGRRQASSSCWRCAFVQALRASLVTIQEYPRVFWLCFVAPSIVVSSIPSAIATTHPWQTYGDSVTVSSAVNVGRTMSCARYVLSHAPPQ